MFENWIILALIAAFLRGIYSFLTKVSTMQNLDINHLIFSSSLVSLIISFFFYGSSTLNFYLLAFAFFMALMHYFVIRISFIALKHISASVFFISSRTTSTILLILGGFFFFQENLTFLQLLGIFFGICVFIFLYDVKDRPLKIQIFHMVYFYWEYIY